MKKLDNVISIVLVLGVVISNLIYTTLVGEIDVLGSISSITGVICVVLVARGSMWNYLFGVITVSTYAWISYKSSIYGDAALNALYYLPMQFLGWWQWQKRIKSNSSESSQSLKTVTKLTTKQRLLYGSLSIVLILLFAYVLDHFEDPQPLKD